MSTLTSSSKLRNAVEQTVFWFVLILAAGWVMLRPAHSQTIVVKNGLKAEIPNLPLTQVRILDPQPGSLLMSSGGYLSGAQVRDVQGQLGDIGTGVMVPVQQTIANAHNNTTQNKRTFTDIAGGAYWTAGASFTTQGVFADDLTLTVLGDPEDFDGASLEGIIGRFISKQKSNGEMPVSILGDGTAGPYYSGFDNQHAIGTGDAMLMLPKLQWAAYSKTLSTAGMAAHYAGLKAGLNALQIDPANGLCQVIPGQRWVPWMFLESAMSTGDHAMCSVLLAQDYQLMAAMSSLIGSPADTQLFNAKYATIQKSLGTGGPLWNSATGTLRMGSVQNSTNVDVDASSYGCRYSVLSASQCASISAWLVSNLATIDASGNGYLRQSNANFAYCGSINSDGSQNISTGGLCASGSYQQAGWLVQFGWVVDTMARTSTSAVATLFSHYLNTVVPDAEWVGLPGVGGNGSLLNLCSVAGPKDAALSYQGTLPPPGIYAQFAPGLNVALWSANVNHVNGNDYLVDVTKPAVRMVFTLGDTPGFVFQTSPPGVIASWTTKQSF